MPEISGKVDGGHPARAELTLEGVAVGEGGGEALDRARRQSVPRGPPAEGVVHDTADATVVVFRIELRQEVPVHQCLAAKVVTPKG